MRTGDWTFHFRDFSFIYSSNHNFGDEVLYGAHLTLWLHTRHWGSFPRPQSLCRIALSSWPYQTRFRNSAQVKKLSWTLEIYSSCVCTDKIPPVTTVTRNSVPVRCRPARLALWRKPTGWQLLPVETKYPVSRFPAAISQSIMFSAFDPVLVTAPLEIERSASSHCFKECSTCHSP